MPSAKLSGKSLPNSRFEKEAASQGGTRIAGVDEAGRGPLAGPVVAVAVVLSRGERIAGINDSKLLPATERERLFKKILQTASGVGIGIISAETIDEINILQATRLAMARAVMEIDPAPDYLLIDGPIKLDLKIRQKPIIKGDRLSVSVAAAAIVAKVTRDRIMKELHEQYPVYGFDRHKGYGTAVHREAIVKYGPCPAHRKCFRGVLGVVQSDLFDSE